MNVITLYQPYASFVMTGIKTWETRPSPPNGDMRPEGVRGLPGRQINAGDRVAIHAARTWAPGWLRWYSPERSDADSDRLNVLESVGVDFHECGDNWWKIDTRSLPLGAILGSVRADRAVRIVEDGGPLPNIWTIGGLRLWSEKSPYPEDEWECPLNSLDISDQLPFGYWNPGNWAWQLSDPQPFAEPIPAKGKQGVWEWKEGTGMQTKVRLATVLAGPPVFAHAMRAARKDLQ